VKVNSSREAVITWAPTDAVRWTDQQIVVDNATTADELREKLLSKLIAMESVGVGRDLLVRWTICGTGPLISALRRGPLQSELLSWLRKERGFSQPAVWSVSLTAEGTAAATSLREAKSLLGDFLREVDRRLEACDEPPPEGAVDLVEYLPKDLQEEQLAAAARLSDSSAGRRVWEQAAALGVDLLSGEGAST
jgi:hypothetical protein